MIYPFPASEQTRLFHGRSSGCFITFKIGEDTYRAEGTEGVRGINVHDVIIIRPNGSAHSDVLGEIKTAEKVVFKKPPRPGTYPALTGGSTVLFHDGSQWFRAVSESMAVKGIDIPDSVTVSTEDLFSVVVGTIEFKNVNPIAVTPTYR